MSFSEKQRVSLAFLEFHYGSMKAALESGAEGCFEDLEAYYKPWDLDLSTNRVPLKIWHGKADVTVPYAHGEWLASNTPNTDLHLTEDDSHRSIFENSFEEAVEWLLERDGR
jgi:pimeloyl-ACP methyl ester carboxylesterase